MGNSHMCRDLGKHVELDDQFEDQGPFFMNVFRGENSKKLVNYLVRGWKNLEER